MLERSYRVLLPLHALRSSLRGWLKREDTTQDDTEAQSFGMNFLSIDSLPGENSFFCANLLYSYQAILKTLLLLSSISNATKRIEGLDERVGTPILSIYADDNSA